MLYNTWHCAKATAENDRYIDINKKIRVQYIILPLGLVKPFILIHFAKV